MGDPLYNFIFRIQLVDNIFRKTKYNRVYEDLVEQIETAILDGKLKAGDKLPPQRELVEMFQTSRGSLREALRVLEQKGLIDIKLGVSGGATVKKVDTDQVTESLGFLIRHQEVTLDELEEFREGVEGDVAALAARRADKEDKKRLEKLLSQAEKLLEAGVDKWEAYVENDRLIHLAIAEIARNKVYLSVVKMVHNNMDNYYDHLPIREERVLQANYDNLKDIVEAVREGNEKDARTLARKHVRLFHRHMDEKKKEEEK